MKKYLLAITLLIFLSSISFAGGGGGKGGSRSSGPQYYSFEDLRSQIRNELFYYENANKPQNALVSLGSYLQYPLCAAANAKISSKIALQPTKYQIDSMVAYANWNDCVEIAIDWGRVAQTTGKGDLIFSRGNGKAPDFVKYFSNWTHVAIVDNPLNCMVFESTPDTNVKVNDAKRLWSHITYYTCKIVETVPYSYRVYLLEEAKYKYAGLPYYPRISTASDIFTFVYRWSDKEDMSSMYCSKLVYHTFKPNINLDSGRTSIQNPRYQKASGSFLFSWIGVSPDDIYYSPSLGTDFSYSPNIMYL